MSGRKGVRLGGENGDGGTEVHPSDCAPVRFFDRFEIGRYHS